MKKKMLSVKNDLIFKKVFGDPKNQDILISFLKSVLDIPDDEYESITIVDPNLRVEKRKDKLGILDLKLKTKSGCTMNIEIQLYEMKVIGNRIMFYTGKLFVEQIGKGKKYDVIKKVVCILILNYNMFKNRSKYNHRFVLYDKTDDTVFSDLLEIVTLELGKLPEVSDNTDLYNWLSLFNATEKEEFELLKEKGPELKKAVVVLEQLSEDEQTRLLAEAHEKKLRDEYARLEAAEERGIEIGEQKGIKIGEQRGENKKAKEIAKNLIESQMDIDKISKITGLSKDEIEELMY